MKRILSAVLAVLMLLSIIPVYAAGPDNSDIGGGVIKDGVNKTEWTGERGVLDDTNIEWDENRGGRNRNQIGWEKKDYDKRLDFAKWQEGQAETLNTLDTLYYYYRSMEEKDKLAIRDVVKSKVSKSDKEKLDRYQDEDMSGEGKKTFQDTIYEETAKILKRDGVMVVESWALNTMDDYDISEPIYSVENNKKRDEALAKGQSYEYPRRKIYTYKHVKDTRTTKDGRTIYRLRYFVKVGDNRYRQMNEHGQFNFLDPVLMRRYNAAWNGMDYNEVDGSFLSYSDFTYCRKNPSPDSKKNGLGERDKKPNDKCYTVGQGQDLMKTGSVKFDVIILNPEDGKNIPEKERGKAYWVSGFNFPLFKYYKGDKNAIAASLINEKLKPKKQYKAEDVKAVDASSHFKRSTGGTEDYHLDLRDTKTKKSIGVWDNKNDGEKTLYTQTKENEIKGNEFNVYPGSELT